MTETLTALQNASKEMRLVTNAKKAALEYTMSAYEKLGKLIETLQEQHDELGGLVDTLEAEIETHEESEKVINDIAKAVKKIAA